MPANAIADQRAYAAAGNAQFVNNNDFVGSGHATHLGLYTEAGSVTFTPTTTPGVLNISGSVTYFAADGDELTASISGLLDEGTGAISGTLQYVGGTGRFVDVSGSSAIVAQLLGGGAVAASVRGSIDY
jgi:hypothetical protein